MLKILRTSLTTQALAGMALSFLLVVFVMAGIGSRAVRGAVTEQYVDAAYHTARTARTYLNPDHIADYLSADGGAHPEEYRHIQEEWQRLADRDSQGVLMIYLIETEGEDYGHIRFILRAAHPSLFTDYPELKLKPIGAVATSGEAQRKAYAQIYQGEKLAVVIHPQQWTEDHITVIVPVKTKENEVAGLLCVQRKMEKLRTASGSHVREVLAGAVALLAIILPLGVWGLHRWFLNPIKTVTEETLRFAEKNTLPESRLGASIRTSNEIGLLARSIDTMEAQNIDYVANLTRVTAKQEQIRTELNVARDIQRSMLPRDFDLRPEIDLAAAMDAAKEVGGDFYDFYPIPPQGASYRDGDRVAVTIADVSGKGVPSALFMVVAKTVLKNFILTSPDEPGALARAVGQANRRLCEGNENLMFVTVFAGVLNVRTGNFTYVNAGHNPPLRSRGGVFEYLSLAQNGFLGISKDIQFKEDSFSLSQGDGVFLYTDGVTEAENPAGDPLVGGKFFGEARLLDALNARAGGTDRSARELLAYVKGRVGNFVGTAPQSDDLTMLYMRYSGGEIHV